MNRLGLHISTTLSESSASVYQKVIDTRKRRVCVMHCCKLGIFLMRVNKIGLRCRVYFGKLLKRYSTTLVLVAYFGRALSSVVEHYLHTVGVAGSKPAARTILHHQGLARFKAKTNNKTNNEFKFLTRCKVVQGCHSSAVPAGTPPPHQPKSIAPTTLSFSKTRRCGVSVEKINREMGVVQKSAEGRQNSGSRLRQ